MKLSTYRQINKECHALQRPLFYIAGSCIVLGLLCYFAPLAIMTLFMKLSLFFTGLAIINLALLFYTDHVTEKSI